MSLLVEQTRLTRRFAYTVAGVQLSAAVTGLLFGDVRFRGTTYAPARQFLSWLPGNPSTWWSVLLAVLATTAILVLRFGSDRATRRAFAFLASYWVWWTILYACAWPNHTAGPWAPWLAAMCVIGNARPVIARTLA